jgi:hypothetical protein
LNEGNEHIIVTLDFNAEPKSTDDMVSYIPIFIAILFAGARVWQEIVGTGCFFRYNTRGRW